MKKIFIVAPHFPPSSLPPSQRVRLLVKHLHSFNWWPVVFTIDHSNREELADEWMCTLTGDNYDTVKLKCISPKVSRKLKFGDLGLRILPFLMRPLLRETKKQKPAFILYPVPPWYIMIIAPLVKKITGVPYAIDFIDPWVHKVVKKGFKAKMSQQVAKMFEGYVVKNSDAVFAVSQGILDDLVGRYPSIKNIPMIPLPYGVEKSDFEKAAVDSGKNDPMIIRYIGAISPAMEPMVNMLLLAFKKVSGKINCQVEFIGTSYAGAGLAAHRIKKYIDDAGIQDTVSEYPDRVGYKKAIELNIQSDLLIVVGDNTKYYAASKLMGLIVSGKPFVAFVHEDSFPAIFLKQNNYTYLVTYSDDMIEKQSELISALADVITNALENRDNFMPIDTNSDLFNEHTAYGMTKNFTQLINSVNNGN